MRAGTFQGWQISLPDLQKAPMQTGGCVGLFPFQKMADFFA